MMDRTDCSLLAASDHVHHLMYCMYTQQPVGACSEDGRVIYLCE